jgi:hypothetical protein
VSALPVVTGLAGLLPVASVLAAHQPGCVAFATRQLAPDAAGAASVASLTVVKRPVALSARIHGCESFRRYSARDGTFAHDRPDGYTPFDGQSGSIPSPVAVSAASPPRCNGE